MTNKPLVHPEMGTIEAVHRTACDGLPDNTAAGHAIVGKLPSSTIDKQLDAASDAVLGSPTHEEPTPELVAVDSPAATSDPPERAIALGQSVLQHTDDGEQAVDAQRGAAAWRGTGFRAPAEERSAEPHADNAGAGVGGNDHVGVRGDDFPEEAGGDGDDTRVPVSDEVLDRNLKRPDNKLRDFVRNNTDATENSGTDDGTSPSTHQLIETANTVLEAQEPGRGNQKSFSGTVVGHDIPRHFVAELWQKDEHNAGIQITMFNQANGFFEPAVSYTIFRSGDEISEFFDPAVERPEGWGEGPATWPTDKPVALKVTYDLEHPSSKVSREILAESLDDPILMRVFDALKWEESLIDLAEPVKNFVSIMNEQQPTGERRGAVSSNVTFVAYDLPANAHDRVTVMNCLHTIMQINPIYAGHIENPNDVDPVEAIEAWQRQQFLEIQASVDASDQDIALDTMKDFKSKVGLGGPERVVVFDKFDTLPSHAPASLRAIQREMVNHEARGAFNNFINASFISTHDSPTTERLNESTAHEFLGHNTEQRRIHYLIADGSIYFWQADTELPRSIWEARSAVLTANYMSIVHERGEGSAYPYLEERPRGIKKRFVHDKYISADNTTMHATAAATNWELLSLDNPALLDALIKGDELRIRSEIETFGVPGLYDQLSAWDHDGKEFERVHKELSERILAARHPVIDWQTWVQVAGNETANHFRSKMNVRPK